MSLKLHGFVGSPRVNKILVTASIGGVEIEVVPFTGDKSVISKLTPLGKVPILETSNGVLLESNAIARYVARLRPETNLLGKSFFEAGQVDQWVEFNNSELDPAVSVWAYPVWGVMPFNQKAYEGAKADVTKALTILNNHLLHHTYMVGNSLTLADVFIVSSLLPGYTALFSPEFIAPFGNVTRWFTTVVNQPAVAKVLGAVAFAKEEAKAGANKAAPKKEEKPAPKKEEKPAPKKEEAADFDEEDLKPKKPKSELDNLPASPMILDAIKKLAFSERPFLKSFFEQLWPQFDANGYSFWLFNYKYNDENKVMYMTSNLASGFLQRSDACRKYCMGVINILGNPDEETPPFKVHGAFLFRGQEVPKVEMMQENPDAEYYDWVKVDLNNDEHKKILMDLFQGEEAYGEKVLERKYFK